MFVLAPKRGPKTRRTPSLPGSRDDQAKRKDRPAKPDKTVATPPLALVPLTKPSADKTKPSVDKITHSADKPEQDANLSPAAPADNPFRRDPIPDVKLKLRELELRKDEPEPAGEPEPKGQEKVLKAIEPPSEPEPAPLDPDEDRGTQLESESESESEPEAGEAAMPAPSSELASDDVEPPEPSYGGIDDGAKPSADPSALLPITSSLIKPRPVRRSRFLPAPAEPEDALEEPVFSEGYPSADDLAASVEPVLEAPRPEDPVVVDPVPVDLIPVTSPPAAPKLADVIDVDPVPVDEPVETETDLEEDAPLEEPESDLSIIDRDLPAPETVDPAAARRERRERLKHRQVAASEAPDIQQEIQQYADEAKGAVSPRLRWLEDLLTDIGPSGVAVAGLVAISMVLMIAASSLGPSAPSISGALTLPIPERTETIPTVGETASAETETPSGPLAGIVSYVGERFVSPAGPATTSPVLAKVGALEGVGQFARAAELAGLQRLLQPGQDYTIFAPNDAAFAKLAPAEIERLLQPEGRERLLALVSHHVVPGRLTFDDIAGSARAYTSLSGQPVPIDAADVIRIGEASLIDADLVADDGVIHVIDTLLIPPTP